MIDWEALDALDKNDLMNRVVSHLERPGNFSSNLVHFGHGLSAFLILFLVIFALYGSLMKAVDLLEKSS